MSKLSQWKNRSKSASFPKREGKREVSLGQKGMILIQELHSNPLLYQHGHIYKFDHVLDREELETKLQSFIDKHEVLRSNYTIENGSPQVHIKEEVTFYLKEVNTLDDSFFTDPFDLKNDLLFRAQIFDKRKLALSIHHIVGDRQSLDVFLKELFSNESDDEVSVDYFDFSAWYNGHVNQEKEVNYWKKRLSGDLPILQLPKDFPRPEHPEFSGSLTYESVDLGTLAQLRNISSSTGCTNYSILLATFQLFLHFYTRQLDILVATPVSNRSKKELESLFGYFNETLVLRNKIDKDLSFKDFLLKVNVNLLKDLEHKNISFDHLVDLINPPRSSSANPLFQTMLLYNKETTHESSNIHVSEEIVDLGISKFDMTLFVAEKKEELSLRLEYSRELFKVETAERMLTDFKYLLQQIAADPTLKITEYHPTSALSLLSNNIEYPQIREKSILQLIDFDSNEPAVVFENQQITYKELDLISNRVAGHLLNQGAQVGDFIGLHCNRSLEMIIGIVSIIKAGCAYVALDPSYPPERLEYVIADSGINHVLYSGKVPETPVNKIDLKNINERDSEAKLPVITSESYVYMIYTSGSSGVPKGVPVTHRNLLVSTKARNEFYQEEARAFLLMSSFAFDSSIAGIFWALCSGGKIVLPKEKSEQDLLALSQLIAQQSISHTLMLPSLYEILLENSKPKLLGSLKNVMVAGEACSNSVVRKHFEVLPSCGLYNEYGPTEGTVWCIAHHLTKEDVHGIVPIGRAIPYYNAFIFNSYGKTVPVGVSGDLYISGEGIVNGYFNQHKLTEEKFIQHAEHGRLYKTGDVARYDTEGKIYFLGRQDNQVKILGHRVELDEVALRIKSVFPVKDLHLQLVDSVLIAYYTGDLEIESRKVDLGLQTYMLPKRWVKLDEFPKLPNGKIDQKSLANLPIEVIKTSAKIVKPSTPTEKLLYTLWQEILQLQQLSIHDNFFELGGNSLKSIQLLSKARDQGLNISPTQIFDHQTIHKLAASLDQSEQKERGLLVTFRETGAEKPLFCIHGGGGHVFFYKRFAELLSDQIPVYSFQPKGLDGHSVVASSISDMARTYIDTMKEVQPEGPYRILGTCFSNSVALEMAHQLRSQGEVLDHLFIIDSAPVHLFGNDGKGTNQTLKRFSDMLLRGDFTRIGAKIKSRFFGKKQLEGDIKEAVEQDEVLAKTIDGLNNMYADYHWRPYEGRIQFIRSSEFHRRKDKKFHLFQWMKLAQGGLDVSIVEGHHISLFEEPEVQGLAEKVSELIIEAC